MLFGRDSRKIILTHPKTISRHIQLSDTTGSSNGTGFYGQMKLKKNSVLAANTQDGFGEHKDKNYPMCTMNIYCCIFDVVGLYFCWRSWTSCLDTWHHGFDQIPTDKKNQVTDSVRNLIMGHVWIFQPDNNPNTNLKNNTKNRSLGTKSKLLLWPFQSSDLNPVEKEWGELKRSTVV